MQYYIYYTYYPLFLYSVLYGNMYKFPDYMSVSVLEYHVKNHMDYFNPRKTHKQMGNKKLVYYWIRVLSLLVEYCEPTGTISGYLL